MPRSRDPACRAAPRSPTSSRGRSSPRERGEGGASTPVPSADRGSAPPGRARAESAGRPSGSRPARTAPSRGSAPPAATGSRSLSGASSTAGEGPGTDARDPAGGSPREVVVPRAGSGGGRAEGARTSAAPRAYTAGPRVATTTRTTTGTGGGDAPDASSLPPADRGFGPGDPSSSPGERASRPSPTRAAASAPRRLSRCPARTRGAAATPTLRAWRPRGSSPLRSSFDPSARPCPTATRTRA
jgi:hypothetical protein